MKLISCTVDNILHILAFYGLIF